MIASWQESDGKPSQCIEKQRHYSADKDLYSLWSSQWKKGSGLPSGHIRLWELDRKDGRMTKNRCHRTVVLEKTPQSPLDSKEIKPVNLRGEQHWIFTGRTDAEAEIPVFWLSYANRWLSGKVPDPGKDWGQKEKRALEEEMAGWHHWCNEHELGQAPGDGEGQGGMQFMGSGSCCCFSRVRLCATPQTAAHQAPPSLGFSRQEHWSGLPLPSPMHESEKWKWSRSVVSNSLPPQGL